MKPTLIDHTEANFDAVMSVNVKGVWLSMKYEIPQMLKAGGGAIVNCSSVAGVIGFPGIGIYSASKHAVIGLTKAAALEFSAQGIRVNAVNPAVIDTEMADRITSGMSCARTSHQRLRRDTAVIDTRAAEALAFDNRDLHSHLCQPNCKRWSGLAGANNDRIIFSCHRRK